MSVIPCRQDEKLKSLIEEYAEALKAHAHEIGEHGLDEAEFYNSGLFRGAIERIRGQFSATMRDKRLFIRHVLNHLQDEGAIQDWDSISDVGRHLYTVTVEANRTSIIEVKGCLDGNNTNIFVRPPDVDEFIIWSVCTNPSSDPRLNTWSGLHTRLGSEMIHRKERVDGVVVWDMACGTIARPCPKVEGQDSNRVTVLSQYRLPPPCLYLLPASIVDPTTRPLAAAQDLGDLPLLATLHRAFKGHLTEINYVDYEATLVESQPVRRTIVRRNSAVVKSSNYTPLRVV